jgi:DNA-binding MarR family transcriptional regulator
MMSTRSANLEEIYATSAMTQRLMRAYMHQSHEALGIGPSEGQLLHFIAEAQPVSLKDLASTMHLTPGAITQLVDGLVEAEYVTRTPSDQDRRVAMVALTPEGTRTINTMRRSKEALFAKVVAELSDEELAAFLAVQRKMLSYLEERCRNAKK